jgi:hypothetical protein
MVSTAGFPHFDLAILFVHGIGKQRPSDTLIADAVPLVGWLKQQNACQEIRLTEGRQKAPDSPAYAVLEGQVSGTPIRWLLAESCWADEFYVPEPAAFAAWMLCDGIWISLMHFAELVLRRVRPLAKKIDQDYWYWLLLVAMPLGPLLCLLLAVPLQVTVILLYLLSLLPVPGLGALAKAGFRSLSEILGNAFAYAGNEVTKVSVETKVRADADWLAEHCNTIAIVAHSQGAAVALGALVQRPRPCTLITYGAGVRKLLRLEQGHRRSFWSFLI